MKTADFFSGFFYLRIPVIYYIVLRNKNKVIDRVKQIEYQFSHIFIL
jgi:hypothetical protein